MQMSYSVIEGQECHQKNKIPHADREKCVHQGDERCPTVFMLHMNLTSFSYQRSVKYMHLSFKMFRVAYDR